MKPFVSVNPATGTKLATYEPHGDQEIARRLERATQAFESWRRTPVPERARHLAALAATLRHQAGALARLASEEMGKPISESAKEIEKCAVGCDYFAEHAEAFLRPELRPSDARESFVRFDPLGPVLAIMPWNFPFWQLFRCGAPAIAAGNVILLKHASNVMGCAHAIERVFAEAGLPEGILQLLAIGHEGIDALIDNDRIRGVTVTGSVGAGRSVAAAAGKALKKIVLELGGSDPFIVLEDADVEAAVATGVQARFQNSGQSCIAAKRFIVHRRHLEAFERGFVRRLEELVVGDPLDSRTQVGPLAREDLLDGLEEQVRASVKAGARIVSGGHRLDRPGWYFAPTLVSGAGAGMPVADDETFGPVAALLVAKDDDEAIALANRSSFGLGASLWTRDLERARRAVAAIEAGSVFVNGLVKSDPRLPFGGVKDSGFGRELGIEGIRELVNVKTVWMA